MLCNSFNIKKKKFYLQTSWIVKSKKTNDMVELCAIFFSPIRWNITKKKTKKKKKRNRVRNERLATKEKCLCDSDDGI